MKMTGSCHCGAIKYEIDGEPITHSICHCTDCRRCAGAPIVGWAMFPTTAVKVVQGSPKVYSSSEHGRRHFCADCGTGLLYTNDNILPGITDVQSCTFDNPEALSPRLQVQAAERISWMATVNELPSFDRYPPQK